MQHTLRFLIALAALVVGLALHVPRAQACAVEPDFPYRLDHITAADRNEPGSRFAREFRDYMQDFYRGDEYPVPEIVGVYAREVVRTVAPHDGWTRGSVLAVAEMWGEAPTWIKPSSTGTRHPDDMRPYCDNPTDGPDIGERRYYVVTSEGIGRLAATDAPIDDVLTDLFGTPVIADRDLDTEHEKITEIWKWRGIQRLLQALVA